MGMYWQVVGGQPATLKQVILCLLVVQIQINVLFSQRHPAAIGDEICVHCQIESDITCNRLCI